MDWREFVEVNPDVLAGKPVLKGTRISVELLLEHLADGWSSDDILAAYPHLRREQVLAALSLVSEVFKEHQYVAIAKATR
jgi:uncharacterized protein (DUF433 family)